MMRLLKIKLKSIPEFERDEDVKGLLGSYENPVDFTDRRAVSPIAEAVRNNTELPGRS